MITRNLKNIDDLVHRFWDNYTPHINIILYGEIFNVQKNKNCLIKIHIYKENFLGLDNSTCRFRSLLLFWKVRFSIERPRECHKPRHRAESDAPSEAMGVPEALLCTH